MGQFLKIWDLWDLWDGWEDCRCSAEAQQPF